MTIVTSGEPDMSLQFASDGKGTNKLVSSSIGVGLKVPFAKRPTAQSVARFEMATEHLNLAQSVQAEIINVCKRASESDSASSSKILPMTHEKTAPH